MKAISCYDSVARCPLCLHDRYSGYRAVAAATRYKEHDLGPLEMTSSLSPFLKVVFDYFRTNFNNENNVSGG